MAGKHSFKREEIGPRLEKKARLRKKGNKRISEVASVMESED